MGSYLPIIVGAVILCVAFVLYKFVLKKPEVGEKEDRTDDDEV